MEQTKTKIEWKCEKCQAVMVTDEFATNRVQCGCGHWRIWQIKLPFVPYDESKEKEK